jgi:hypothetical protein
MTSIKQVISQRRNFLDEFHSNIQWLQTFQNELEQINFLTTVGSNADGHQNKTLISNNSTQTRITLIITESVKRFFILTTNDYFHFMFINNLVLLNDLFRIKVFLI